ncbi:hypothetical protein SPONN_2527 [uncultured Candidatus Thioglobus sp.]|nr:hypothetical protein SPONN_2527 [uncultured Candidatus Thioglobus sp.]
MLELIKADYQEAYKILLKFNNNRQGVVDLKDWVFSYQTKTFKQIQTPKKFKNFKLDYTLTWNNEVDIAPEYLYFQAFKKDKALQQQFKDWGYLPLKEH